MTVKLVPKLAGVALALFALSTSSPARAEEPPDEEEPIPDSVTERAAADKAAAEKAAEKAASAKAAGDKASTDKAAAEKPALDEAGVEEPAEDAVEDDILRGLSWDVLAGGVPAAGAIGQLEIGFSGLPRVSYHYTLGGGLSVGGMASFDYAYWAPRIAFAPSILLQAPVRYSVVHNETISFGVRADPGIGFFLKGPKTEAFTFGLLLNVSASIGFTMQNRMIIGGGVDIPAALGANGDRAFFRFPILIGPIFEFHATPPLAMTFDFKIGPHLTTGSDTIFGFRLMAGVAYRL